MNLFVPEVGAKLVLLEDWEFILHNEYRNDSLYKNLGLERAYGNKNNHVVRIPKDTILTVRRVYIRQGLSQYSSLTFSIAKKESPDKSFWGSRFWASLNDVNQIKFELKDCNEELRKTAEDCLFDIKEKYSTPIIYKYIETILLETGNINTFRPIEEGYTFFRKAIQRVKDKISYLQYNTLKTDGYFSIENYTDILTIMNKYFRKYKIAKMIDDSNEEIKKEEV